ncbi:MAG TPA: DUF4256 domain-containing protein [Verrucomicrobiales bacterium]|nr:DUF4256 domain-containing protein [Verrucomicrobiales bacterium]
MKKELPKKERGAFLNVLQERFDKNPQRHQGIEWAAVRQRLEARPDRLWTLAEMERTGGEPDVTGRDEATGEILFCDCSPESPKGRRSLCYDRAALDARKEHKPAGSALDLAAGMGVEVLSEAQYLALQQLGPFDTKTSSWVLTPPGMRKLGGALFGDSRYGRVFFYHNGAESYYSSRGFRACLRV